MAAAALTLPTVPGLPEKTGEKVDELRGCIDGRLASDGRDGLADGIMVV